MFGERLFSVQRSAFGVGGCSCSVFCSAPFAACCFVRRSVRKGWACGVLFDVVFGFGVLFGVVFGKACFVHSFVLERNVWTLGPVLFGRAERLDFCLTFCSDLHPVLFFVHVQCSANRCSEACFPC